MNLEEFKISFREELKKNNIELDNYQIEQFYNYMKLLLEWNEKINLTAIIEPEEIIKKHFIDSLTILKYIKGSNTIIDVGTGAGFPGIPLKIALPQNKITLIDSLNKRIIFLEEVKKKLKLENLEIIHVRAEDGGKSKKLREKFDIAVSRAVAKLNVLLEYTVPFVKKGGFCICMKSNKLEEELKNSNNAINELDLKIEKKEEFLLEGTDIKRTIIIFNKKNNTKNIYPRKAGIPNKNPL